MRIFRIAALAAFSLPFAPAAFTQESAKPQRTNDGPAWFGDVLAPQDGG